jgi:uncharacterized GH25 family protein
MITHLSNPRRLRRVGLAAAALCILSQPLLRAHDFWLEPSNFSSEPGQIIGVRLRVGQDLIGDPVPRDPALVKQLVVEDTGGRKPLVGRQGGDPAGYLRVLNPGLLVIGYLSNPSAVELDAAKFNQYLKDEGLDAVAAERIRRAQTGNPARELFSRCAKSLVLSGPPTIGQADRTLGFPLELVAQQNPYELAAGGNLTVRLTYENRPLAGALVVAMNRLNVSEKQLARTGADGRVRFCLRQGGFWLIKAVHMIPAPAGSNADWASFWASLTFQTQGPGAKRN